MTTQGVFGWLVLIYVTGFVLAVAAEDDPLPVRFVVAALWPLALAVLVAVLALAAAAALVTWPAGLLVTAAVLAAASLWLMAL